MTNEIASPLSEDVAAIKNSLSASENDRSEFASPLDKDVNAIKVAVTCGQFPTKEYVDSKISTIMGIIGSSDISAYGSTITKAISNIGSAVGYKFLSGITLTGTQYIDTGFKPNTTTTQLDIDLSVSAFSSSFCGVAGCRNQYDYNENACLLALNRNGVSSAWSHASSETIFTIETGTKYSISCTRPTIVINDNAYTGTNTTSVDMNYNLFIGNFCSVGKAYTTGLSGTIYTAKLYSEGVLVRNFVPVLRVSDNAVGMLDTLNNVFYTNSGTGTFGYIE